VVHDHKYCTSSRGSLPSGPFAFEFAGRSSKTVKCSARPPRSINSIAPFPYLKSQCSLPVLAFTRLASAGHVNRVTTSRLCNARPSQRTFFGRSWVQNNAQERITLAWPPVSLTPWLGVLSLARPWCWACRSLLVLRKCSICPSPRIPACAGSTNDAGSLGNSGQVFFDSDALVSGTKLQTAWRPRQYESGSKESVFSEIENMLQIARTIYTPRARCACKRLWPLRLRVSQHPVHRTCVPRQQS
jgi:hypothetical protein